VEIVGLQLSDYTVAKRTLSQYFESVQGNRQQQLSLTKMAQKADESILQYTTRVQELARRVHGDATDAEAQIENAIINAVFSGATILTIRKKASKTKDLKKLMTSIVELEKAHLMTRESLIGRTQGCQIHLRTMWKCIIRCLIS
jgi:rubrerythrin